jgi:hypothetical protein
LDVLGKFAKSVIVIIKIQDGCYKGMTHRIGFDLGKIKSNLRRVKNFWIGIGI